MIKALLHELEPTGLGELDSGDFEKAICVYTGGLSLCQDSSVAERIEFLSNRALALVALGRRQEARLEVEEALRLTMSLIIFGGTKTRRGGKHCGHVNVLLILANMDNIDVWTIQQEAKTERRLFHSLLLSQGY